ncbi:MAG: malto-oligosyltrehalose synthase, partial [Stellaceae bacterium]
MSEGRVHAPPIRATYRLQFHRGFTFGDAAALVPYLAALGVSHLYASPITEARPGSTHGYDIIDHNRLNPEIGSDEDFRGLTAALGAHDMGLIVDFVPNHMGIGADNAWWLDVLEWGQESPFARYFDINWHALRADLEGRVLLPILGEQYGVILDKGEIMLRFDPAEGSFSAWYFDHRFPISPRSYPMILDLAGELLAGVARDFAVLANLPPVAARERAVELKRALADQARDPAVAGAIEAALQRLVGRPGQPDSFGPLHRLLEAQSYRIADWRVAAEEINYRRFFNINDLAGLRMELPELFEQTHRLMFGLIERGELHGLRIDHIDGLFDPQDYCERLQQRSGAPLYVLVEKILARYEILPDWPVAGTTGYDFVNQVLAVFVDPQGEAAMSRLYRRLAPRDDSFDDVLYACKKRIMQVNLASEMNVIAREFHQLAMRDWGTRDFTLNGVLAALEEVVAAFPVYRTYVSPRGAGADDLRYIDWAIGQARQRWRGADTSIFDFLRAVLSGEAAEPERDPSPGGALHTAMHFQQVTGPVMAKAAEDTAFYRYVRLLALNEVGGDPRRFGMSVAAFHHLAQQRARRWPRAMVTTSTHDTKRGEDARARLALLSEMPREWGRRVFQWLRLNRSRRSQIDGESVPDRNVEYLFYQTLLGAWPPALAPTDVAGMDHLAERIEAYMIKAVRERKLESSWSNPNAQYEAALQRFVRGVLDASRPNPFLAEFHGFVAGLARAGAITSLSQLVLKLTVPGVPDIYQGGELWDFSLVDPDNRRPVDWDARRTLLETISAMRPADLARDWQDGREKLFATRCLLALRGARPALFAEGDYQPLET